MTTIQRTETRCDLCGYGGPYSDEAAFERHSGFDFCRWCCSGPMRSTSCGGHTVTLSDGSWSCDCGTTYGAVVLQLRTHGVSLAAIDAVPHIDAATAAIHVQTPNWPRTY